MIARMRGGDCRAGKKNRTRGNNAREAIDGEWMDRRLSQDEESHMDGSERADCVEPSHAGELE